MLRKILDRLFRRKPEKKPDNPVVGQSVDDIQADASVAEHLGGVPPERLSGEDVPPGS